MDSPECTYCGLEDNILHFLLYCPNVAFFWKTVNKWLRNVLSITFEEELEEALILNSPDKTTDAKMENLILLSLKFCQGIQNDAYVGETHMSKGK